MGKKMELKELLKQVDKFNLEEGISIRALNVFDCEKYGVKYISQRDAIAIEEEIKELIKSL